MKIYPILFIASIISFYSCNIGSTKKTDIEKILFTDESSNDLFSLLESKFITLETCDENLISQIKQLKIDSDRIYIIDNLRCIHIFNISGKYIGKIGEVGNGPKEYTDVSNIHIDTLKQEIVIADRGQRKLLYYDLNDFHYLRNQRVNVFMECVWLKNGNILWYQPDGYTVKRKKFYLEQTNSYGEHISFMCPSEFSPQYQITFGNTFSYYNDKAYFYAPFLPYIYDISEAKEEPAYEISPQKHSFAPLDWLQTNANKNYSSTIIPTDYISAYSFHETDTYFCIQYCAKGANPFLGFHRKQDGKSYTYSYKDFITGSSLNSIGQIINTYQDYFITTISPAAIKDRSCHVPELAEIAKNIKEDDNPIVCLFKFNQ